MEYILSCEICQNDYNATSCIPVVTECGHSFCLSCINNICERAPVCPKCRKQFDKTENFPINFILLNIIDECNSKKNLSTDLVCSIRSLKEKLISRIAMFDQEIYEASLNRNIIESELKTLEALEIDTQGESGSKIREILKEVEKRYREISLNNLYFEDSDRYSDFSLKKSKSRDTFLLELYKSLKKSERIFAFKYIEMKPKFGELLVWDNKILIRSLSMNETPDGSKTVPFEDLKASMKGKIINTFIDLQDRNSISFTFILKFQDSKLVPNFLKLCTGEYGISYKDCPYFRGEDAFEFVDQEFEFVPIIPGNDYNSQGTIVSFESASCSNFCDHPNSCKRMKSTTLSSLLSVDFSASLPSDYYKNMSNSTPCAPNSVVILERPNEGFQIFRVLKPGNYFIFGHVFPSDNWKKVIFDDSSISKIKDCGIAIEL